MEVTYTLDESELQEAVRSWVHEHVQEHVPEKADTKIQVSKDTTSSTNAQEVHFASGATVTFEVTQ